jgi:hypothetical protein
MEPIDKFHEGDILNSIERRLHRDRGTLDAECFALRLLNVYTRWANGFYDSEDPWEHLPKPEEDVEVDR